MSRLGANNMRLRVTGGLGANFVHYTLATGRRPISRC